MGMARVERKYWHPKDVQKLPYGRERYECIGGELLVTPSPRELHQAVVGELYGLLRDYLRGDPILRLRLSPADLELEDDTLVQPDIFVYVSDGGPPRPKGWKHVKRVPLVIEILSKGSARFDRGVKRALYQRNGVGAYWIFDLDARAVECWTPEAEVAQVERERVSWRAPGSSSDFVLPLEAFYQETIGDSETE